QPPSCSPGEHPEVAVGDLRERRHGDRGSAILELAGDAVEGVRQLGRRREGTPSLADELRVSSARTVDGGKPAGERLEEGVRAGVVQARGDVDVVAP